MSKALESITFQLISFFRDLYIHQFIILLSGEYRKISIDLYTYSLDFTISYIFLEFSFSFYSI